MEDLRSKSAVDWRTRDVYGAPPSQSGPYDLRCYSMCHVSYYPPPIPAPTDAKKGRNPGGGAVSRTSSLRDCLTLSDPEMQRKRRVAGYKMYAAEGKIKMSVRKSFKWIKTRYQMVIYGW